MSPLTLAVLALWFTFLACILIGFIAGSVAHVIKTKSYTDAAAYQWHAEHEPEVETERQIL
jgi:hypothetical protein